MTGGVQWRQAGGGDPRGSVRLRNLCANCGRVQRREQCSDRLHIPATPSYLETVPRMRVSLDRFGPLQLIGLGVVGLLTFAYGQALGALLVEDCDSFNPPFRSVRCAQPYVAVMVGAGVCLLAILLAVRLAIRRWRGRE
jgi:hypothetical protein